MQNIRFIINIIRIDFILHLPITSAILKKLIIIFIPRC